MIDLQRLRFEVLPFAKGEEQAAQLPEPVRLTVTTSPKHGIDHTLDVSERLRALGHAVTVHLATRMLRDRAHLDEVLDRCARAGIDDLFVVGGDATEAEGPYAAAGDVLELLGEHPQRPAKLGIGAYPEGHALIGATELDAALVRKQGLADYMVTQLCFDPEALLTWVRELRARGVALPIYAGVPGPIDRKRLLDVSMKVGVGTSVRFLRKQNGLLGLLRRSGHQAATLRDALEPHLGDPALGIEGFHLFTFNDLVSTYEWTQEGRPQARSAVA